MSMARARSSLPAPAEFAVHSMAGYRVALRLVAQPPRSLGTQAPHVLLVHGMVDSGLTWQALWPGLAQCHVWVAEMPWSGCEGVGWSHVLPATEWLRLAMALCPHRPTLCVGHSFGATVLLDWAASAPAADADGLMLIAPFYCGAERTVRWDDIDKFARAVPERLGDGMRARPGSAQLPESVLRAMAQKLSSRVMPDALLELMRLYLKSRQHKLGRLPMPVRVVHGERDGALVRQSSADLQRAFQAAAGCAAAAARFDTLQGCGHHPMHEQPERLQALLHGFLEELAGPHHAAVPCAHAAPRLAPAAVAAPPAAARLACPAL